MVRDAERPCRLGHGQPFAIFFRGSIGVDSAHASNGGDTVRRPSLALARGQAHSIERRGDVFVRPPPGHAAHDGQRIFGRRATMLAGSWLTDTQLGVLTATPMDRQHDLTRFIVDIDDDVGDQRSQQLLAGAHRNTRRVPGRRQIVRQVGEGARVDS